jgi:zinc protease
VGARYSTGVIRKQVEKGIEPKSETVIVFTGPFQYDQDHRAAIRAMADVLENKLRDVLREDLGGTYSVSVSPNYTKIPREEYSLYIEFGCSPARTDDLIKTVFDQIEQFKSTGPTDKQVADVKETFLRDYETQAKQNSFFLNELSNRYRNGEDLAPLFNLADYYRRLSPAIIQDAAKTYLNTSNYVNVSLFPEKK